MLAVLRFCWRKRADLLDIFCASIFAWWLLSVAACIGYEQQAHHYDAHKDQAIFLVCFCGGPITALGSFWAFVDTYSEAIFGGITGAATIAIAYFTLTLKRSTDNLWDATNKSATIAERALTELEIPFVSLKIVESGLRVEYTVNQQPAVLGFATRLRYCFANYGRTPALLTEIKLDLKLAALGKLPDPVDQTEKGTPYPIGVMVAPSGESAVTTRPFSEFLPERADHKAIKDGEKDLFIIGFLKFSDVFKTKHTLGFCLKFDRKGDGFVPDGDERYNYKTEEKVPG